MEKELKSNTPLRVIKTARDIDTINQGSIEGFWPLIKKIKPSKKIRSKYAVYQNKETGEVSYIGDFRSEYRYREQEEFKKVIGWTYYYPYSFDLPIAAYLIPKDLQIGERVLIEDLIEDYVGPSWNQGDTYRLDSCEAIWNGKDLVVQYSRSKNRTEFYG